MMVSLAGDSNSSSSAFHGHVPPVPYGTCAARALSSNTSSHTVPQPSVGWYTSTRPSNRSAPPASRTARRGVGAGEWFAHCSGLHVECGWRYQR